MKIRAFTCLATFAFAGGLAVLGTPSAQAAFFDIADGQCGGNVSAQCSKSNGIVTATAMAITEIHPVDGNQAWANFQAAFNSWNPVAPADHWTLQTATLNTAITFSVVTYRAYLTEGNIPGCGSDPRCGGVEIQINYNDLSSAPPNPISDSHSISASDAIWAQSISTNQKRNPSQPGNPYLDNAPLTPGADLGPPAYPFQYDSNGGSSASMLYDKPSRDDYAVWTADAWLSTADYSSRTLTVYDGFEWGFTVAAPLPATWVMMLGGLAGFGGLAAFRRQKSRAPELSAA